MMRGEAFTPNLLLNGPQALSIQFIFYCPNWNDQMIAYIYKGEVILWIILQNLDRQ